MWLSIRLSLAWRQRMAMAGEYPDTVIACFGGGSNFGGIAFPFMRHKIKDGKNTEFIAAEPESCPKLTRGKLNTTLAMRLVIHHCFQCTPWS